MVDNKNNENNLYSFSNIITKSKGIYALPKNIMITKEMLIEKVVKRVMRNGTPVYATKFNKDFWYKAHAKYGSFDVTLDEAHSLMNARSSMSKQNKAITDFLALIRKICNNPNSDNKLTLISQLDNRIDVVAREMATEIRYHICVYEKVCKKCSWYCTEHSELSDYKKLKKCTTCGHTFFEKVQHRIIVYYFDNITQYRNWKDLGLKSYTNRGIINNVSQYFKYYDTFQLDDLISEE